MQGDGTSATVVLTRANGCVSAPVKRNSAASASSSRNRSRTPPAEPHHHLAMPRDPSESRTPDADSDATPPTPTSPAGDPPGEDDSVSSSTATSPSVTSKARHPRLVACYDAGDAKTSRARELLLSEKDATRAARDDRWAVKDDGETPTAAGTASHPELQRRTSARQPSAVIGGNLAKKSRTNFKQYWEDAHQAFGTTVSAMMLKSGAQEEGLNDADRNELLEWIGAELVKDRENRLLSSLDTRDAVSKASGVVVDNDHSNMGSGGFLVDTFLEVGAGIGRLTPFLMPLCKRLIAVDFIDEYIAQNRQAHSCPSRPNDAFICADAMKLTYPDESIDFLFWNWLMMYLSDDEIETFVLRSFRWVKKGGYIFCRESCGGPSNRQSRDWARNGNPTEYRVGSTYTQLFQMISAKLPDIKLHFIFSERPVSVYKEKFDSSGQLAWFIRRV